MHNFVCSIMEEQEGDGTGGDAKAPLGRALGLASRERSASGEICVASGQCASGQLAARPAEARAD